MLSPKEYGDHVADCMDRAKAASSDAQRNNFLELAKKWLETAVQADIPTVSMQSGQIPMDAHPNNYDTNGHPAIIQWNSVLAAASPVRAP
jgi:hypothetical protein